MGVAVVVSERRIGSQRRGEQIGRLCPALLGLRHQTQIDPGVEERRIDLARCGEELDGTCEEALMLSRTEGLDLARHFLEEHKAAFGIPVRIVEDDVFVAGADLIAQYCSVARLEGDSTRALGGNMPVHVDLATGECRFLTLREAFDYGERKRKAEST
ncbi:hypothetical protein GCM10023086_75410 [Streptomyces venetus]|uniref:Uncharacterized protein n=1 Tax=Streptomyces venetus TaxID=1701086 RepID=A0ABP8HJF6_9ACTN